MRMTQGGELKVTQVWLENGHLFYMCVVYSKLLDTVLSCSCWVFKEFRIPGRGEGCLTLNNQRPMIESHLGHHSDTDIESVAVADEQEPEIKWPHSPYDAGRSPRYRRPDAVAADSLSQLLDRRQELEVLEAVLVFCYQINILIALIFILSNVITHLSVTCQNIHHVHHNAAGSFSWLTK